MNLGRSVAILGGGCFWCTEAVFKSLKGVIDARPGYSGGHVENPTYEEVVSGRTGHVEVVKVEFFPSVISFEDILTVFFSTHDPTSLNKQGSDIGTQYASVIFYMDESQRSVAGKIIKELKDKKAYDQPIVTELRPLENFFEAEDYHENYYENHKNEPYCELVIEPKLADLNKRFRELLAGNSRI